MSISRALSVAALGAACCGAPAAPLDLILERPGSTAAGFDVVPELNGQNFVFGSLVAHGGATVTYTYLGSEAGRTNLFGVAGSSFTDASMPGETLTQAIAETTLLHFGFGTLGHPGDPAVVNGRPQAAFAIFGDGTSPVNTSLGSFQYVLGFNDGAPDADHDDLVIGVSAVPEPGSLALASAGLAVCGLLARRRRQG